MDFLEQLFLFLCFVSAFCLAVGLVKPWMMLWWEHVQNRRKVIKLYGTVAIASYLAHLLLRIVAE